MIIIFFLKCHCQCSFYRVLFHHFERFVAEYEDRFERKYRLLGDLCRCAVRALLFYFQAGAGKTLEPGVIAVIQTFGDRINFHPHLHFLVTEGGMDEAGVFQRMSSFDDARLAEVSARKVLGFLVRKELLSPEWAEPRRIIFFDRNTRIA